MKIVVMAGGKGTRIASLRDDIPKPMIPVCGKPVLEHLVDTVKRQGYEELFFVVGHLGKVIEEHFGDGSEFGVSIRYIREKTPLGTAGALYYLKEQIREDFLLLNGDIIFDIDIGRMLRYHRQKKAAATIFVHPNDHPYDSGIVEADRKGKVARWLTKEERRDVYHNRVNAGIHVLSPEIFSLFERAEKKDLDRDVLKRLIPGGKLFAYSSSEYVKDMGTPQRLAQAQRDISSGLVAKRNLSQRQTAVFLDRDGTVNRYKGFIRDAADIELCAGAAKAIRRINESGYLALIVSNQPVIARGEADFADVDKMMYKIETLLGEQGAYLDDFYYCPHHPHGGFPGERAELKGSCTCRKPEPGLLLQAAQEYHIDLAASFMIGDSMSDVEAGTRAGCTGYLLKGREDNGYDFEDLLQCVNQITGERTGE